jgi:hypothetical protein
MALQSFRNANVRNRNRAANNRVREAGCNLA